MYIDGVLVWSGASFLLDTTSNTRLHVGYPTWGDGPLTGALDELMVFNRTLTAAEVAQIASPARAYLMVTPIVTASASATPGLACLPSLFRALARTDLVGAPLADTPVATVSEGACRIACCDVPSCDGYVFAFTELRLASTASCSLYANVSATVPNSFAASGLRMDVVLPGPPASASPAGTHLPASGWPQRSGSVTPTATAPISATASASAQAPAYGSSFVTSVAGDGTSYHGDGAPAHAAGTRLRSDTQQSFDLAAATTPPPPHPGHGRPHFECVNLRPVPPREHTRTATPLRTCPPPLTTPP